MRAYGRGILPQSQIYLYDVSEETRRMFLYALCVGHYECSTDYVVKRQNYDSYLLIYVQRGLAYYCDKQGQRVSLPQGSFVLIDCYSPHEYGAIEESEIYWMHFDGPTAADLAGVIFSKGRFMPRNFDRCRNSLIELVDRTARHGLLEAAVINRLIVLVLTEFLVNGPEHLSAGSETIAEVQSYILSNPAEDLSLEVLARRANMSPYHFARQFKSQVGMSPHDYLIHTRLNLAVFYLLSTNESVKNIAYTCGFSSECGFCTTFKKRLGTTPSDYRQNAKK